MDGQSIIANNIDCNSLRMHHVPITLSTMGSCKLSFLLERQIIVAISNNLVSFASILLLIVSDTYIAFIVSLCSVQYVWM